MRALPHPDLAELELATVLEALSDPTRLSIVLQLDDYAEAESRCGTFLHLGTKTNLTYHFAKLRAAGVVRTRVEGTARYMSLRKADLDRRFPGLLGSILSAARKAAKEAAKERASKRA